ncbi:MAG TPA: glycosyltransferase [Coleofasciculaceae cyanobacterium]
MGVLTGGVEEIGVVLINHGLALEAVPVAPLTIPNVPYSPNGGRSLGSPPKLNPIQLSLVVPTYNERENVIALVQQLSRLLDDVLPNAYELIVVDDNSPDHTWRVAQDLMADYPQLRVMRRQHEQGLSSAVIRGWQVARGEVLGVIDGDLQHPPESLFQLLKAIWDGADLAIASRHVEGGGVSNWSLTRRLLSRGAQLLGLLILPGVVGRVSDPMSGYFLVRRAAIAGYELEPRGYKILLEVLGRGQVGQITEVGYVFQERQEGTSKVSWKQYRDYVLHLAKLRSRGRISRLRAQLKFPSARFVQFCLVGLSGVMVDMTVLYLLSDPAILGWGLTRSKVIAAELAILNNFFWNDRWTFADLARSQIGRNRRLKRLLKFNIICLMGLILNVLLLNLFFNGFGMNRYLANLLAIAAVTVWNFWINLKLNWRVTQVK